ncbi:MAG: flagellar export protein FliJ [Syntrophomonadaceae bacterium]
MKPFKFKLQTVQSLAERQEQLAREELARCINIRNQIRQELELAVSRLTQMEELIKAYTETGRSLARILLIKDYIPVQRSVINETEERLKLAEEEVEKARQMLQERSRETNTLEKLHEKEWHSYLQEFNREEQKIVDEMAINRYYRTGQR